MRRFFRVRYDLLRVDNSDPYGQHPPCGLYLVHGSLDRFSAPEEEEKLAGLCGPAGF